MPVNDETLCKRMVSRVSNAIHNPASSGKDVKNAIVDLKHNNIIIYKADYDDWINEAIHVGSERKLMIVLMSMGPPDILSYTGMPFTDILSRLIKYSVHTIPRYIASRMFRIDHEHIDITLTNLLSKKDIGLGLNLVFRQPKMASTILRFANNKWFTKNEQIEYMNINPVLYRKKQLRKILLRFWILTIKKVLGIWREALYMPGTGALYLKALNSFKSDQ